MTARQRGAWAEDLACRYLSEHGLALLTRNYRCRRGEIDLVMRDGPTIVFVEVRYRRRTALVSGAESVDSHKCARLVATAEHYLQRADSDSDAACRFDVVAVAGDASEPRLEWIRRAFDA